MTGLYLGVLLMLVLLLSGFWVASALGAGGFLALALSIGVERALSIFGTQVWATTTDFVLTALPLYVLMGELLYHSGILERTYRSLAQLGRLLPGRLLQANILTSTFFAAVSGSSLASAATIGRIAYPSMRRQGYEKRILLGSIAAGGTLGILIPPSIILILYGALAQASIGKLFLAGLLPGLLLAACFSIYIALYALWKPQIAPVPPSQGVAWRSIVCDLWQVTLLIGIILVGLYGGLGTPTEIASFGAVLALGYALFSGENRWSAIWEGLRSTVRTTSMILFIVMSAKLLAVALAYYSVPPLLQSWVSGLGLSTTGVVIGILCLYLILGCLFDGISMMVITLPFTLPILQATGIDLIWFGILLVLVIEIGLLTPPVGMNLFILQGVTREKLGPVIQGSVPFMVVLFCVTCLIYLIPQIALWLPTSAGS